MALRRRSRERGSELFPGFTDVEEIGLGSLAAVFRAREIGTNRLVALKLLNVRDASPRSVESFERESVALGKWSGHAPERAVVPASFALAGGVWFLVE